MVVGVLVLGLVPVLVPELVPELVGVLAPALAGVLAWHTLPEVVPTVPKSNLKILVSVSLVPPY